jgi:hypothetical protein
LIDGNRATEDDAKAIPVSLVDRIDVMDNLASMVTFRSFADSVPYDGVISIILSNDYNAFYTPVFHSVNVRISGYDEPRIFYSPKHYSKLESDYKPDLRTTLFWEPNIKIETNKSLFLNYFNDDNPSDIRVIVEGITSTGIPLTSEIKYEVK